MKIDIENLPSDGAILHHMIADLVGATISLKNNNEFLHNQNKSLHNQNELLQDQNTSLPTLRYFPF